MIDFRTRITLSKSGLSGIVTVLNTPFDENGKPDHPALEAHVRYAIETGVSGFLVPAMASEVEYLSRKERREIVSTVVRTCDGRVPVIGGASAEDGERVGIVRELIDIGCEGILVSLPFVNESSYRHDVDHIVDAGVDYLMIQDWDSDGYGLPVDFIAGLHKEIPAFACLKIEVVPAGPKYTQVKAATGGTLHVAGGWAVMHLIDGLDRGVDIFMPTGLHELYVGIFNLYQQGRRDEAINWFRRLLPVLTFSNQQLDVSILFFKRLLYRQGLYPADNVRCSTRMWDEYNRRQADHLINEAIELTEEMKNEVT